MTQITADMVRDLRERTGVGMMECKKALVAANGEMELAIESLRKAGQATAVKKGSRIAAEGVITASVTPDNKVAVIGEINCETDFVAREDRFKKFGIAVVQTALKNNTADAADVLQQDMGGKTVEATRLELVAQLGENLAIRRIKRVQAPNNGVVAIYLHGGDGTTARIGSVVALDVDNPSLAKDIAMHIAAMRPEFLDETQVPQARAAKEKEIFLAQAAEANAGKPAEILEKIIGGKMSKFLKEITLLGQPFVKNPDQTISALLSGSQAKVTEFVRFEVGEGIEKKATDFVSEVMAQVKG